jgi:hypothetical protein
MSFLWACSDLPLECFTTCMQVWTHM